MGYQINFESFSSNFSLPTEVASDELATLNGDYLKVILLIFKNADKNYSIVLLSNLLNLPEDTVKKAVDYWIGRGLLINRQSETIPPKVIVTARRGIEARPVHPPAAGPDCVPPLPKPPAEHSFLLECMENLLRRPVTPVEYKSVVHILEYIKLPADVVLMAIEYCTSIEKMNSRYLEKVCASWADNGITTHELAEQYLSFLKKSRQNEGIIKKMFGIENRNLIESEKECIARWFGEFQFGADAVQFAYEKTVTAIGKVSFPYTNKILQSWFEKGYKTVDDVKEHETGGRKSSAGRTASYDIDELDEYWKNNVPKFN